VTALLALKSRKLSPDELYSLKLTLAKNLLFRKFPKKKINNLLIFLKFFINYADPEYNVNF
jgi:hypothetical protein